jgi:hypothetical protein
MIGGRIEPTRFDLKWFSSICSGSVRIVVVRINLHLFGTICSGSDLFVVVRFLGVRLDL